jgi:TolA-binding protein
MFANAKDALRRFVTQFPSSEYTAEAQSLLDDIGTTKKD